MFLPLSFNFSIQNISIICYILHHFSFSKYLMVYLFCNKIFAQNVSVFNFLAVWLISGKFKKEHKQFHILGQIYQTYQNIIKLLLHWAFHSKLFVTLYWNKNLSSLTIFFHLTCQTIRNPVNNKIPVLPQLKLWNVK